MDEKHVNLDRRKFMTLSSAAIASPLFLNSIVTSSEAFSAELQAPSGEVNDEMLSSFKEMMNYTDAQWEAWTNNPRNFELLKNGAELQKYRLVAEVTSAYGCGAGHKVGDRIVFSGGGLLCKESPEQICFGLLSAIIPYVNVAMEKVFDGEDPTKIAFNKAHCPDVGVDHGGWGEVIVEVTVKNVQV